MRTLLDYLRGDTYLKVNIILGGVIILIMVYSLIFSPDKGDYPVACIHEVVTGQECVSCGLSHSFSLILQGRIDEANQWNSNGMRVFFFFGAQLFLRLLFSFAVYLCIQYRKHIIAADISISIFFFLFTFYPFLKSIFNSFTAILS
jgi:hypothetical protein